MFNHGLDIEITTDPIGFKYGSNCFGPEPELRTLDSIRKSLMDPNCKGPNVVYSIAMDVGMHQHKEDLLSKMLLFGAVTYSKGKLGNEPVRSQGHIHKISTHCGWSTPEVYEIWSGKAIILMQEYAEDNPGRCFAVEAGPGEVVIVPPKWAHATISADPMKPLTFGAWCDRDYGFIYDGVRKHNGLAFYPILDSDNKLNWEKNKTYTSGDLIVKKPRKYIEFNISDDKPLYQQYMDDNDKFLFVSNPQTVEKLWLNFIP